MRACISAGAPTLIRKRSPLDSHEGHEAHEVSTQRPQCARRSVARGPRSARDGWRGESENERPGLRWRSFLDSPLHPSAGRRPAPTRDALCVLCGPCVELRGLRDLRDLRGLHLRSLRGPHGDARTGWRLSEVAPCERLSCHLRPRGRSAGSPRLAGRR